MSLHTVLTLALAAVVLIQNRRRIAEGIAWAVERWGRRRSARVVDGTPAPPTPPPPRPPRARDPRG